MQNNTPTGSLAVAAEHAHQDDPALAAAHGLRLLSVIIPARDEAGCIASTVEHLHLELGMHGIPHEIIVVDDGSSDKTWSILSATACRIEQLVPVKNGAPHGFGRALQRGIAAASGDAIVFMMADESDDCRDVVRYWQKLGEGYDCVFGSRFMKGGGVIDYPRIKLLLNRMANAFIKFVFAIRLNDTTNAFKAYRREVIDGCTPLLSPHFNITVELPLKAIVRGYSWTVIPITWRNRRSGVAKLKIREMGSRYFLSWPTCGLKSTSAVAIIGRRWCGVDHESDSRRLVPRPSVFESSLSPLVQTA